MSDDVDPLLEEIRQELVRARTKFPGDNVTFAALVEEVGELATATFEESRDRVRKEAVQTAVMSMRMVLDGDHTFEAWRAAKGLDPLVDRRTLMPVPEKKRSVFAPVVKFVWNHMVSILSVLLAITVAFYINAQIARLTEIVYHLSRITSNLYQMTQVSPEDIEALSGSIQTGAINAGEGIGDGAAKALDRAEEAWKKFRSTEE